MKKRILLQRIMRDSTSPFPTGEWTFFISQITINNIGELSDCGFIALFLPHSDFPHMDNLHTKCPHSDFLHLDNLHTKRPHSDFPYVDKPILDNPIICDII